MNFCTNCGHELGVGRFCTNCGKPVPGRHPGAAPGPDPADPSSDDPTVVRPAVPAAPTAPPAAPPVGTAPPAARYPLYADPGSEGAPPVVPPAPPAPPAFPVGPGDGFGTGYAEDRRRGVRLPVLLAVLLAVLVVIAAIVAFSLIGGHDDKPAAGSAPTTSAPTSPPTSDATTPTTTASASGGPADDLGPDVAKIEVPGTAPASTDLAGHPVTFDSRNMLDGDADTAWRIAGDASGESITFSFDKPVTISSVGLINGYSKKYPGYNGYWLNRKILEVRWTFEDGTTVTQDLRRRTTLQTQDVDAGPTSSLRMDIVSTVASNKANSRDYTAISEVALQGSAG